MILQVVVVKSMLYKTSAITLPEIKSVEVVG